MKNAWQLNPSNDAMIETQEGKFIASVNVFLENKENHLIAAAPEMLEALEEVVEVLRQYGGLPANAFKYDRLIKKAKGEN